MSVADALAKYAKAARLSAQAAKLFAEAAEEMAKASAEAPPPPEAFVVTEVDIARARRALRRAGVKVR